jgi:hypothetical protein
MPQKQVSDDPKAGQEKVSRTASRLSSQWEATIKDEKSPRHRHRHQKDSPERIIRRDGDEESSQTDQEVDSDQ